MTDRDYISVDPDLRRRLTSLASKLNKTFESLAEDILRTHADELEREVSEHAEDERRWQQYLQDGHVIPYQTIRAKLRARAAEAARKVEQQ